MPKANWIVRHSTALIMGAGLLLFVDSRVTKLLVDGPDERFDWAIQENSADGWRRYVEEGGSIEKAQVELSRHHDVVRARLRRNGASRPDGLDPLLAVLLERVDERVYLEAEPLEVDESSFAQLELPDQPSVRIVDVVEHLGHGDWTCARGLSAAFTDATSSEFVLVQTPDAFDADPTVDAPRLVLRWSAAASGSFYGSGDKRLFPGFTISASLRLATADGTLAFVDTTIDPGQTIAYTTYGVGAAFFDGDHADIVDGMLESACQRLGERLISELTGWTPSVPASGGDDLESSCEGGDASACIALGEQLRETDPMRALAFLVDGCNPHYLRGGEACVAAAELALAHPTDPISPTSKASVLLDFGCQGHYGPACARKADLDLMPLSDGVPAGPERQAQAFVDRLRACDLGAISACAAAAEQAERGDGQQSGEPSLLRASLLWQRTCDAGEADACERADALRESAKHERMIHGVQLTTGDEPFDVRWGVWLEHAPTEVVWIASAESRGEIENRLAAQLGAQRVRIYDPAALPPGPSAPANARTIYAIAKPISTYHTEPRACPECTADVEPYLFGWPGCACLPQ
jgi:hypothetical protein